jgi:hypothetical protein
MYIQGMFLFSPNQEVEQICKSNFKKEKGLQDKLTELTYIYFYLLVFNHNM